MPAVQHSSDLCSSNPVAASSAYRDVPEVVPAGSLGLKSLTSCVWWGQWVSLSVLCSPWLYNSSGDHHVTRWSSLWSGHPLVCFLVVHWAPPSAQDMEGPLKSNTEGLRIFFGQWPGALLTSTWDPGTFAIPFPGPLQNLGHTCSARTNLRSPLCHSFRVYLPSLIMEPTGVVPSPWGPIPGYDLPPMTPEVTRGTGSQLS